MKPRQQNKKPQEAKQRGLGECPEGNTLSWKVPAQVKGENKGTQKCLMAECSSGKTLHLPGKDNGKERIAIRASIKKRSKRKNKNHNIGNQSLRP